jgi:hypothetical protein
MPFCRPGGQRTVKLLHPSAPRFRASGRVADASGHRESFVREPTDPDPRLAAQGVSAAPSRTLPDDRASSGPGATGRELVGQREWSPRTSTSRRFTVTRTGASTSLRQNLPLEYFYIVLFTQEGSRPPSRGTSRRAVREQGNGPVRRKQRGLVLLDWVSGDLPVVDRRSIANRPSSRTHVGRPVVRHPQ